MTEHGFAAVGFGLLPSLISLFYSDEKLIWVLCSCVLTLFLSYALMIQVSRVYRAKLHGARPRQLRVMLIDLFGAGSIALILQVINVLLWRGPGAYGLGCAWLLYTSCRQFSIFLMHIRDASAAQPGAQPDAR